LFSIGKPPRPRGQRRLREILLIARPPLLAVMLERYPQVVRWTRASGTTGGKGEVPSLAKEGTPRHQVNGPVPLEARPGWFVQLPIIGGLNQPLLIVSPYRAHIRSAHARLRPLKEASRHFINGRSHPSLSKEGTAAFPPVVFNAPVSSKKMWDMARHHCKEGWPSDSENIAKHPLIARPGWFSDESKRKTTRLRLLRWLRQIFFDDAATPPCGGARRGITPYHN